MQIKPLLLSRPLPPALSLTRREEQVRVPRVGRFSYSISGMSTAASPALFSISVECDDGSSRREGEWGAKAPRAQESQREVGARRGVWSGADGVVRFSVELARCGERGTERGAEVVITHGERDSETEMERDSERDPLGAMGAAVYERVVLRRVVEAGEARAEGAAEGAAGAGRSEEALRSAGWVRQTLQGSRGGVSGGEEREGRRGFHQGSGASGADLVV